MGLVVSWPRESEKCSAEYLLQWYISPLSCTVLEAFGTCKKFRNILVHFHVSVRASLTVACNACWPCTFMVTS